MRPTQEQVSKGLRDATNFFRGALLACVGGAAFYLLVWWVYNYTRS